MSSLSEESSVLEEGPLVWVLDDQEDMLGILSDILEQAGYRFDVFQRSDALFQAMDEATELPAALVLDWMLGGAKTGADVLARLRRAPRWRDRPVLVLTALSGESVLNNAFEAGASDVVRKPFSLSELMARLRWQIERGRALARGRLLERDRGSIVALAQSLMRGEDVDGVIAELDAFIEATAGVEAGFVYLYDVERAELVSATTSARLDLSERVRLSQALAAREQVSLRRFEFHGWFDAEVAPSGPSATLEPLVSNGELVGVMVVVFDDPLSPRHRRLSSEAAPLVAAALARALSHERELALVRQRALLTSRTENRLDFLSKIIEASPDAIVAASRDGSIIFFNGAAERILGWSRAEALEQNVRRLYAPGVAREIMKKLRSREHGGWGKLDNARETLIARDGRQIPVELSAALLRDGDTEIGSVGLFKDMRERLAIEDRLERATQDLEASRERIVMAELAGATAHELNQPLTSVLNYAELLSAMSLPDDRARRAASVIHRESERIAEIVRRIGQITNYRTREYVGVARIVDLGDEP